MKTTSENTRKKSEQGNLGQTTDQKQEKKQDQNEKKEPQWSEENTNKLIDAFSKDSSKILIALAGCATAYFIYQLYQENKQLKEEFRLLKNKTRSQLGEVKHELKRNNRRLKKRVEDVFDVTDVEGSYVIKIDEQPDNKSNTPFPEAKRLNFLA